MKLLLKIAIPLLLSSMNTSASAAEAPSSLEFEAENGISLARMNDVSILYPLAQSEEEFQEGYLKASSEGHSGPILPRNLFTSVVLNACEDCSLDYDTLRLVAFRWDPCFAHVGPLAHQNDCQNQLRLILQPLVLWNSKAWAKDAAVHLFFSLTREQLLAGVKETIALRHEQSSGIGSDGSGPLVVHPIMKEQGLQGPMSKGLNAIVLKYAGASNLVRFASFESGNAGVRWDFKGFDIKEGKIVAMNIPDPDAQNTKMSTAFAGFVKPIEATFSPLPPQADDFSLLVSFARLQAASDLERQKALDATFRIENPDIHSPDTISCAGCHMTSLARSVVHFEGISIEPSAAAKIFVADPEYVSPAETALTTAHNDSVLFNLHSFSYQFTDPMISPRVINETAGVIAYLNRNYLNKR